MTISTVENRTMRKLAETEMLAVVKPGSFDVVNIIPLDELPAPAPDGHLFAIINENFEVVELVEPRTNPIVGPHVRVKRGTTLDYNLPGSAWEAAKVAYDFLNLAMREDPAVAANFEAQCAEMTLRRLLHECPNERWRLPMDLAAGRKTQYEEGKMKFPVKPESA